MNNDNEIMNEFYKTFNEKDKPPVEAYRATQNAMSQTQDSMVQPQFVEQTVQNNNQNIVMPNYVNQFQQVNSVPLEEQQAVLSSDVDRVNNQENLVQENVVSNQNLLPNDNGELYNTSNYINGQNQVVKKKKTTFKINPELKGMFILVVVLLIVMSLIPTLFDWFDRLKIVIFG